MRGRDAADTVLAAESASRNETQSRSHTDGERETRPGAHLLDGGRCVFRVWAPHAHSVDVVLDAGRRIERLDVQPRGYHAGVVSGIADGDRYRFRLDGADALPDPASRLQPDGVHGDSAVVDHRFDWRSADWSGLPLDDYVIYELHVGTFTAEGTLDAAATQLADLRDLGITAIELMPVAQFPGARNWGYDGTYPFATQNSYGGPQALKRFVDRCHELGMAAILDVVYNHLGPDGNYLSSFGPYFIDRYRTPWGDALNFDGPGSDEVREYFIANALQWVDEFRFDALRLDAVHAILDQRAQPFLRQLAQRVNERAAAAKRHVLLFAESDLGDPRMIRPVERGGLAMDAQWLDDFHHALHALLTGESDGYYADYGSLDHLIRCYNEGFVYSGQYSRYRQHSHGAPAPDAAPRQFVVCSQNHDQIGNRMMGERLTALVDGARLRVAAAATLLSPFTPLLFMGEEYGETAPFPYFVSHTDAALADAVRAGRREEFAAFEWAGEPPDPQAEGTFASARLQRSRRDAVPHADLYAFYRALMTLRRELPRPDRIDAPAFHAQRAADTERTAILRHGGNGTRWLTILHLSDEPARVRVADARGTWLCRLDSSDPCGDAGAGAMPARLHADGNVLHVHAAPWTAVVFKQAMES